MAKKSKKKKAAKAQGDQAGTTDHALNKKGSGDAGESSNSRRSHWWETYRGPLVGALAAVVLAGLWGPTRDWIGGATDSVHDFVVYIADLDGRRIDDMEERIQGRPFWEDSPSFKGDSLNFLADHLNGRLVSTLRTGTTSPEILTVDELVEEAPNLNGDPIIIVGKFFSSTLLGGDILTLAREEAIVSGNDFYAYIANGDSYGGFKSGGYENLVAAQGVLVATGRAKASNDPDGVETAYFVALERISVSPRNPDFRRTIRLLSDSKTSPAAG